MKKKRNVLIMLALLLMPIGFAGCSSDSDDDETVQDPSTAIVGKWQLIERDGEKYTGEKVVYEFFSDGTLKYNLIYISMDDVKHTIQGSATYSIDSNTWREDNSVWCYLLLDDEEVMHCDRNPCCFYNNNKMEITWGTCIYAYMGSPHIHEVFKRIK